MNMRRLALNPATSPTAVEEILTEVDLILVMTVDPGFGGQELIPATLDKTRRIADLLASSGLTNVDLEVDGGAGATIAVADSAIFSSARPVSACMTALRAAAAQAAQARADPGEQECPRLRSVKNHDRPSKPACSRDHRGPGPALHRHDPHAVHGRRAGRELRPSPAR